MEISIPAKTFFILKRVPGYFGLEYLFWKLWLVGLYHFAPKNLPPISYRDITNLSRKIPWQKDFQFHSVGRSSPEMDGNVLKKFSIEFFFNKETILYPGLLRTVPGILGWQIWEFLQLANWMEKLNHGQIWLWCTSTQNLDRVCSWETQLALALTLIGLIRPTLNKFKSGVLEDKILGGPAL